MADLVVGRFGLHLPSWEGVPQFGVNIPFAYLEGFVARWQGDSAKAQAAFSAARSEVAKIVEKEPDFPPLSVVGYDRFRPREEGRGPAGGSPRVRTTAHRAGTIAPASKQSRRNQLWS
jgi:hypothetical protein